MYMREGDDEDWLFIPAGMGELAFPGENHGLVLANISVLMMAPLHLILPKRPRSDNKGTS